MISYTREEVAEPLRVGDARQDAAERAGYVNYGGVRTLAEQRENHRLSAVGEWLAAWFFRLRFKPSIGVIDAIDLGFLDDDTEEDGVEVRARRVTERLPVPDLIIRPTDKLVLPHVLICVELELGQAEVAGWLVGWEALQRGDKGPLPGLQGLHAVPPPYHSVESLQHWIAAGHRRHWNGKPRPRPFAERSA